MSARRTALENARIAAKAAECAARLANLSPRGSYAGTTGDDDHDTVNGRTAKRRISSNERESSRSGARCSDGNADLLRDIGLESSSRSRSNRSLAHCRNDENADLLRDVGLESSARPRSIRRLEHVAPGPSNSRNTGDMRVQRRSLHRNADLFAPSGAVVETSNPTLVGRRNPPRAARMRGSYYEAETNQPVPSTSDRAWAAADDIEYVWKDLKYESEEYCVKRLGMKDKRSFSRRDFAEYMGESFLDWVDDHPGKRLTRKAAQRYGMTEDGSPLVLDDEYDVQYLTYISRPKSGFPHGNSYYGGVLENGRICWWVIMFYSLGYENIVDAMARNVLQGHCLRLRSNGKHAEAEFTCTLQNRVKAYDQLDEWCTNHPGKPVKLTGPGSRRSSSRCGRELIVGHRLLVGGMPHFCVFTAICNAVHMVVSRDYAKKLLSQPLPAVWSLSALSLWVQKYASCVTLDRVDQPKQACISWLLKESSGVYLIRMRGSSDVDHVVCVDTARKWMLDGAEGLPLRLSHMAFDDCCGDRSQFEEVEEIRKVRMLVHPSSKNKHTRSGSKKRRRRSRN